MAGSTTPTLIGDLGHTNARIWIANMQQEPRNASQLSLAECFVGMTAAAFLIWLVLHPHNLLITFVSPVVLYCLGEGWRARRNHWDLEGSIKTAALSTIFSAPLTGVAGAIQRANDDLFSVGLAAFLAGTLVAVFYGLMPALTAVVVYSISRDIWTRIQRFGVKTSKDSSNAIVESGLERDPVKISPDADEAQNG